MNCGQQFGQQMAFGNGFLLQAILACNSPCVDLQHYNSTPQTKISAVKSFDSTADMAQMVGVSRALKMPHWGIFARRDAKRRARAVRISPCSPCIVCRKNKKQRPAGCCLWRRRWDSNPRGIAAKLISSQSRYDLFDTSAYLVFIAPPRTAFGKMRDFDAR